MALSLEGDLKCFIHTLPIFIYYIISLVSNIYYFDIVINIKV